MRTLALLFLLAVIPTVSAQGGPQKTLPIIELIIGDAKLKTEVASTPNQQYMGLSYRKKLAEDEAMLFAYPQEEPLVFTMRNTIIPLSIAFISEDLIIQEIIQMSVGPGQLFPAQQPAQFALEVNQGWFKRNNIEVGAKVIVAQ